MGSFRLEWVTLPTAEVFRGNSDFLPSRLNEELVDSFQGTVAGLCRMTDKADISELLEPEVCRLDEKTASEISIQPWGFTERWAYVSCKT